MNSLPERNELRNVEKGGAVLMVGIGVDRSMHEKVMGWSEVRPARRLVAADEAVRPDP